MGQSLPQVVHVHMWNEQLICRKRGKTEMSFCSFKMSYARQIFGSGLWYRRKAEERGGLQSKKNNNKHTKTKIMEQNTPNRPLHTTTKTQEAERMSKLEGREDCHEMLISACGLVVAHLSPQWLWSPIQDPQKIQTVEKSCKLGWWTSEVLPVAEAMLAAEDC